MEIIEHIDEWRKRFADWRQSRGAVAADDLGEAYPFVRNQRAPFTPARCALTMLNLALISSAGAYIDGTEPFEVNAAEADVTFREIPVEVEANDLRIAARGYDAAAVNEDLNALLPLARLFEFEQNGIIGQLNPVFWSCCGFIPDAARIVDELLPRLIERIVR